MARQGVNFIEGFRAGVPVNLSVFQESNLGELGPLQLSILSVTQGLVPHIPSGDTRRISHPLPSILEGNTFDGYYANDGFWGGTGLDFAGSLVIETQSGSVSRRWSADLAAGTYQLPSCDQVRVSAWLYCKSNQPLARAVVNAVVKPGNGAAACKPWLWTAQAVWASEGEDTVVPECSVPEGAFRYRAGMPVPHVVTAAPPAFGAMVMEASRSGTYTGGVTPVPGFQQVGEWYPIGYPFRFVKAAFSNPLPGGRLMYPYIQFEIRP